MVELAPKGKKYPKIKVLVVHPSKQARVRIERFVKQQFGCKVQSTTNFDRALNKLIKTAESSGPAGRFHMVVCAHDITSGGPQMLHEQGPALADVIKSHPLLNKIAVILEVGKKKLKGCKADIQVTDLNKLEAW